MVAERTRRGPGRPRTEEPSIPVYLRLTRKQAQRAEVYRQREELLTLSDALRNLLKLGEQAAGLRPNDG